MFFYYITIVNGWLYFFVSSDGCFFVCNWFYVFFMQMFCQGMVVSTDIDLIKRNCYNRCYNAVSKYLSFILPKWYLLLSVISCSLLRGIVILALSSALSNCEFSNVRVTSLLENGRNQPKHRGRVLAILWLTLGFEW